MARETVIAEVRVQLIRMPSGRVKVEWRAIDGLNHSPVMKGWFDLAKDQAEHRFWEEQEIDPCGELLDQVDNIIHSYCPRS